MTPWRRRHDAAAKRRLSKRTSSAFPQGLRSFRRTAYRQGPASPQRSASPLSREQLSVAMDGSTAISRRDNILIACSTPECQHKSGELNAWDDDPLATRAIQYRLSSPASTVWRLQSTRSRPRIRNKVDNLKKVDANFSNLVAPRDARLPIARIPLYLLQRGTVNRMATTVSCCPGTSPRRRFSAWQ